VREATLAYQVVSPRGGFQTGAYSMAQLGPPIESMCTPIRHDFVQRAVVFALVKWARCPCGLALCTACEGFQSSADIASNQ
jgi:hypothetical protein